MASNEKGRSFIQITRAMAVSPTTAVEIMKKVLTCDLCKGILKEPRYLGCHHTFCTECLLTQAENSEESCKVICPTCLETTRLSTGDVRAILNSNKIAGEIVKIISPKSQSTFRDIYFYSSVQIKEYEGYQGAGVADIMKSPARDTPSMSIKEICNFENSLEETNDVLQRRQSQAGQEQSQVRNHQGISSRTPDDHEGTPLTHRSTETATTGENNCYECCILI
ncbi:tripartite motif-containing protein 72-like [Lytechinus variegatus]|uniref:tripartite motif-containing protein 72-like n=1 Tax=Lytechinus variegatus TaxID=7654 RepID=UPI001BB14E90|nr:tripartite motif-containing protein 72-like [Lytechinus variegatus]